MNAPQLQPEPANAPDDRLRHLRDAGRMSLANGPGLVAIALERAAEAPDRVVVVEGDRSVARGEMLVAFVVPAEVRGVTLADMTAHLDNPGLAKQKFPERLEVAAAPPVNAVGKVQKPAVRVMAADTGAAPGSERS